MNVPNKFEEQRIDLPYPHVANGSLRVGKIEALSILVGVDLVLNFRKTLQGESSQFPL